MKDKQPVTISLMVAAVPDDLDEHRLKDGLTRAEWQAMRPVRHAGERRTRLAARWLLRQCLARATGEQPDQIPLFRQASGKPFTAAPWVFSLSHQGSHVALVWSDQCEALGVDLDRARTGRPLAVARRFFEPDEARGLEACPLALRQTAFAQAWCMKEAALKCAGLTVARHLNTLRIRKWAPVWNVDVPPDTGLQLWQSMSGLYLAMCHQPAQPVHLIEASPPPPFATLDGGLDKLLSIAP